MKAIVGIESMDELFKFAQKDRAAEDDYPYMSSGDVTVVMDWTTDDKKIRLIDKLGQFVLIADITIDEFIYELANRSGFSVHLT